MPRRSSASAKGCGASATSSPSGEPRLPGLPRRVAAGRDVHRGLRPGQRPSLRRPVFPRLDGARAQAPCGGAVGARAGRAQRADGRRDAGGARARHRLRGEEDELRAARQSARAHPLAPGSAARRRSRPAPACLDPHARAARALARRAARPHRRHPRPPEEMTPWSAPAAGTGREWALVGAAWLAIALCVAVWLAIDNRPPEWDHANHLQRVVACARDLATGDWRMILKRSSFYPPIVPCAAAVAYRLMPTDVAAAQVVMLLFLGAGMAATYALARALADGTAGVAAAWIFGSAPFVVFSALRFQLDLPLATLVAVALLVLIRTEGFTRVGWSLVAGGVFAVGMLIKPPFAAYLLPPVVWLLVEERSRAALGPRLRGVALAVLAVVGGLQVSAVAWAVPPPVTLPGLGTPWVLASPPAGGDWRQRDFLRIIVQDRAGRPAMVSVVPNDNYFSVSNFRYYAGRDELPLRFTRPWEGEPLGIDYMILKSGDQGPDFSEAKSRRVIERLARDPALARAYPVIAEFPLPDGSTGMLRARRITDPAAAPPEALARRLEAAMRRRVGEVARDVDGLEIRLSYDAEIARGRIQRLEVTARAATAGELRKRDAATLRLQHLRFVAADVLINPYALEAGRAELLDVGRFRLEQMEITAADLQAFVAGLKGFRGTRVQLVPGAIDLVVEQPGPDLAARVRLVPAADRPFAIAVDRARPGWGPLPRLLVNWVVRNYDPTPQIADRLPFRVEVARVSVSEQAIRVGE